MTDPARLPCAIRDCGHPVVTVLVGEAGDFEFCACHTAPAHMDTFGDEACGNEHERVVAERDQLAESLKDADSIENSLRAKNEALAKQLEDVMHPEFGSYWDVVRERDQLRARVDEEQDRAIELTHKAAAYRTAMKEAIDCLTGACPYLHGGTNDHIAERLRRALATHPQDGAR